MMPPVRDSFLDTPLLTGPSRYETDLTASSGLIHDRLSCCEWSQAQGSGNFKETTNEKTDDFDAWPVPAYGSHRRFRRPEGRRHHQDH
jgi:hypothetical protein